MNQSILRSGYEIARSHQGSWLAREGPTKSFSTSKRKYVNFSVSLPFNRCSKVPEDSISLGGKRKHSGKMADKSHRKYTGSISISYRTLDPWDEYSIGKKNIIKV